MDLKFTTGALISIAAYLLGGYDAGIEILIILTVLDYITGIAKAFITKTLSSYIGWKGIIKKACNFICIIVAVQLEKIVGKPNTIHDYVAFTIAINEIISIFENLVALDFKVPEFLKRYLKIYQDIINTKAEDQINKISDSKKEETT